VVDLSLSDVIRRVHATNPDHIVAVDERTQAILPSQVSTSTSAAGAPDRFLILVQVPAHATLHVALREDANAKPAEPLVFGREAPERKDDFAWENKMVAYRVYGPALQATGEITSGIDVWSKRVPNFVIDTFYKRDHEGALTHNSSLSYHKDNGQGLDSYEVGPSRGCGGTAVFADGKLYPSKNYTTLKVLASGPIRFAFELGYAPWDANGVEVTETKRITLDAGSHLNRIDSSYTFAGGGAIDVAAGLAVHAGADPSVLDDGNVLSVWDTPQDPTAGRIATGMVSIKDHRSTIAAGHALMVFHVKSGEVIPYAAGSGWSKADMPNQQAWNDSLKLSLLEEQHPLEVRWK
jgi:unsaturated rhamnogalacturonyl hydrolase